MTKLLNIDANAKTVKGQKRGFMTAILYLAPYLASGVNLCPMAAIAKCWEGCLNTAGRGGIAKAGAIIATDAGTLPDNAIQHARLKRSELFNNSRREFMVQLEKELRAFIRKAKRASLVPVDRLNCTSDIQWESVRFEWMDRTVTIFELFPEVQFYDYTKLPARFARELPANYHLSLSYSGANAGYGRKVHNAHAKGAPMVVVVRDQWAKDAMLANEANAIDGDESDLRFLDPAGALVVLKAKGKARSDTSGFVVG